MTKRPICILLIGVGVSIPTGCDWTDDTQTWSFNERFSTDTRPSPADTTNLPDGALDTTQPSDTTRRDIADTITRDGSSPPSSLLLGKTTQSGPVRGIVQYERMSRCGTGLCGEGSVTMKPTRGAEDLSFRRLAPIFDGPFEGGDELTTGAWMLLVHGDISAIDNNFILRDVDGYPCQTARELDFQVAPQNDETCIWLGETQQSYRILPLDWYFDADQIERPGFVVASPPRAITFQCAVRFPEQIGPPDAGTTAFRINFPVSGRQFSPEVECWRSGEEPTKVEGSTGWFSGTRRPEVTLRSAYIDIPRRNIQVWANLNPSAAPEPY